MLNHWARQLGRDVRAHSAGSAPSGHVNPWALKVLAAAGIDAGTPRSKSWDEFAGPGAVITACDSAAREACPYFPGAPVQALWGYPDPSNASGGNDARRIAFELTRQALGYRLLQLLSLPLATLDAAALRGALQTIACS